MLREKGIFTLATVCTYYLMYTPGYRKNNSLHANRKTSRAYTTRSRTIEFIDLYKSTSACISQSVHFQREEVRVYANNIFLIPYKAAKRSKQQCSLTCPLMWPRVCAIKRATVFTWKFNFDANKRVVIVIHWLNERLNVTLIFYFPRSLSLSISLALYLSLSFLSFF